MPSRAGTVIDFRATRGARAHERAKITILLRQDRACASRDRWRDRICIPSDTEARYTSQLTISTMTAATIRRISGENLSQLLGITDERSSSFPSLGERSRGMGKRVRPLALHARKIFLLNQIRDSARFLSRGNDAPTHLYARNSLAAGRWHFIRRRRRPRPESPHLISCAP